MWFVVACTAERFFRVDHAQEHLHYLTDIAHEALYVLDPLPQTPDDETAFPSPDNSNNQSPSSLLGEQSTPDLRYVTHILMREGTNCMNYLDLKHKEQI